MYANDTLTRLALLSVTGASSGFGHILSEIALEKGDLVDQGPHDDLVDMPDGIYAGLHRSWVAHRDDR